MESWLDYDLDRIDELLDVLRTVRDNAPESSADIGQLSGISTSAVNNMMNRGNQPLAGLIAKRGEVYELSHAGEAALPFPWRDYLD